MAASDNPVTEIAGAAARRAGTSVTSEIDRGPQLGLADLAALVSRVAVATIFVGLYVTGALPVGEASLAMLTGLGILVVAALFGTLALLVWKVTPRRALRTLLLPDLISAALIIFATGMYQDPFYPWMIGLAMIYGAGLALRQSVFSASLVAFAYGLGHVLSATMVPHASGDLVIIVFKAVSIIVTAALVGDVARRQAERETQLRQSQRHYHELTDNLSRRLSELRAVSEITEIIHSTLDFEQVGNLVLEIVSKVIDLPASSLFVIDKRKDETLYSASFGVAPEVHRRPGETYSPRSPGVGEDMFACTTILERGNLIVVFCATAERLEALMSEDRLLLAAVANDLTIAVENSELYKLTKHMAITDELTGLNNYRFMLQRLDDEIERARRFGRNLSLLMLDADNFKLHNDTHGHVAGDAALSELADVMRRAVRDIDVVCRYGGEEFAILLPETDSDGAFCAAEKVREAVSQHRFGDADGVKTERLTVSIGLSTFPRPAADREELLRQADDALYVAKRSGRNRVRASAGTAPAAHRDTDVPAAREAGTST